MPINLQRRTAKVVELIGNFTRNVAYLRGAKSEGEDSWLRPDTNFWRTVTSNNVDMAVIEWCKLFVEKRGKHRWQTVVSDHQPFADGLVAAAECSLEEFQTLQAKMAEYRNKWVAHTDLVERAYIPSFDIPLATARELYRWIVEIEFPRLGQAQGDKDEFDRVYEHEYKHARSIFTKGS